MATLFWVGESGGSGTWALGNSNWSYDPGDDPVVGLYPTTIDDVVINLLAGQILYINSLHVECANLNISGSGGEIQSLNDSSIDVYVDVFLTTGVTYTNINIIMKGGGDRSISLGGVTTIKSFTIDGSGTFEFGSFLQCERLIVSKGTINLVADVTLTGFFSIVSSNEKNINLNDKIVITPTWSAVFDGTTFNAGTSTVKMQGEALYSASFDGGGLTYNNVELNNTMSVDGNNTFNNLKFASGKTITFVAGSSQIVGNLTGNGSIGSLITIKSNLEGNHFSFFKESGNVEVEYWDIQDCHADGEAIFRALESVNSGGNRRWIFGASNVFVCQSGDWVSCEVFIHQDNDWIPCDPAKLFEGGIWI